MEEDMLFDKTYECPLCNKKFKERTLRTGKARLIATDIDLALHFEGIEPLKYDVILCPHCGYTAVSRYFLALPQPQKKMIQEQITANFKAKITYQKVFTYEDALNRYKLALANAAVKGAKNSEIAYICLRAGWLLRSKSHELQESQNVDSKEIQETKEMEDTFLKKAYDEFLAARASEEYPMCGMDESTADYLLAALAVRFHQKEAAEKLISDLILSPSCSSRIKDRVRELKETMMVS